MTTLSYKRQAGMDAGFVASYMRSMSETETPHAYDFWCAVWAIGAACGRDVVVPRPHAEVHSNWYVVLVADSGVTRKSTAVRRITRIVSDTVPTDAALHIRGRTTPEALEQSLHLRTVDHGDARAIIAISELVTFLGRERYNLAMPGLLTDLYDCADIRHGGGTVDGGNRTQRGVHVSFLSASTPSWLASAINPDVVEGGFTSRCIFVHDEQRKKKIAWTESFDASIRRATLDEALRTTVAHAKKIGRYYPTDGAMKRFKRWYASRRGARDEYTKSFESREDDHVLRLAMCLAINDMECAIEARHMERAIRVLQHVKAQGTKLFLGGVRPDRVMLGVNRMIEVLLERGAGGVPQTHLFMKCRHLLDATSFNAALDIMHELQMVDRFTDTRRGPGRKGTIWRATKNINDMGLRDDLAAEMEVE